MSASAKSVPLGYLAERYGFGHYDSLIIAAALQIGSAILYTEDMQ